MTGRYILNENGKPVPCEDLMEWARWFETSENRVLRCDKLEGSVRVSTVFLGLDHAFGGSVPVLWETMIFGGEHDQYQDRYSTQEEAIKGHEKALRIAKGEEDERTEW